MDELSSEQATLGGMIVTPRVIPEVIQIVKPGDFHKPQHGVIFNAITALWGADENLDPVSLAAYLSDSGDLAQIGGQMYLFSLVESAPVGGGAVTHAKQVRKQSRRRLVWQTGVRLQQLAEHGEPETLIGDAQSQLDAVSMSSTSHINKLGDGMAATLERVYEARAGHFPQQGVMTGFARLDDMTNGFKPGQMIIIAARPGVGKSTLAVDIMRHAAIRNNEPCLMFSLEMSSDEVRGRVLSAEAEIRVNDMNRGNLNDDELSRFEVSANQIMGAPIFIDDNAENSMMDIVAKTKIMVKNHGVKLVVIDYLQLLRSGKKAENRQQEVSDFSRQIKLLAKSCGVPIIAIAQLNRGVEHRDSGVPKISDLRESGSLEQDADMVMLIHRPDSQDPEDSRSGEADIILGKHRGGQTGVIGVAHQLHYSRFVDMGRWGDEF